MLGVFVLARWMASLLSFRTTGGNWHRDGRENRLSLSFLWLMKRKRLGEFWPCSSFARSTLNPFAADLRDRSR